MISFCNVYLFGYKAKTIEVESQETTIDPSRISNSNRPALESRNRKQTS